MFSKKFVTLENVFIIIELDYSHKINSDNLESLLKSLDLPSFSRERKNTLTEGLPRVPEIATAGRFIDRYY